MSAAIPVKLFSFAAHLRKMALVSALIAVHAHIASAAAAPQRPEPQQTSAAIAIYRQCLKVQADRFFQFDPADAAIFPLMRVADHEVFLTAKTACASLRADLIENHKAQDDVAATLNAIESTEQAHATRKAAMMRERLTPLVAAINAPGPRSAIALPTTPHPNYPIAALRGGETGTSTATFTIATDGRVSACQAAGASPRLNAATCHRLLRWSRFAPAKDKAGNLVSETRSVSMTYKID